MAERPRDGDPRGARSPGERDFTWLYGKSAPPDGSADDDKTRMLPVQSRRPAASTDAASPASADARPAPQAPQPYAPPTGPLAPTPGGPGGPGGGGRGASYGGSWWSRRLRSPRFYRRAVLVLLVLWVVFVVAVPFITWTRVSEVAFASQGERPSEQPGTTYLLVGSDSRADLTKAERKELATGNPTSELTDTIMLLHTGDGPNVLLSIPRDSVVDMPGYGQSKINSAYSRGGAPLLTQVIETETGVRVDQYVEIGLGGVADVVDAVGGITVCPRERMVDPLAGLRIRKGCQEVDGTTALGYSRSRKVSALGDLDRVRRQREVIAAIGDKVLSPWSVINPLRWWNLNSAVPSFFGFGEGMGKIQAGRWALAMSRTTGDSGLTCTMPVTDSTAEYWDMDRAGPLLQDIIDDQTDQITKSQCTPSGIVGAR